jgi:curved DNA-binding protein CbpA
VRTGNQDGSRRKPDYYELLQVAVHADVEVIEAAYRRLAQRYHPDRNPGDEQAAETMVLLNEARVVLIDPQRRVEYDRAREKEAAEQTSSPADKAPETSPSMPERPLAERQSLMQGVGWLVILGGWGIVNLVKFFTAPPEERLTGNHRLALGLVALGIAVLVFFFVRLEGHDTGEAHVWCR